jgi:hypothetical protein
MKGVMTKRVLVRKRIISQVLGEDGDPRTLSKLSYFLRGKDAEQLHDIGPYGRQARIGLRRQ